MTDEALHHPVQMIMFEGRHRSSEHVEVADSVHWNSFFSAQAERPSPSGPVKLLDQKFLHRPLALPVFAGKSGAVIDAHREIRLPRAAAIDRSNNVCSHYNRRVAARIDRVTDSQFPRNFNGFFTRKKRILLTNVHNHWRI